MLRNALLYMIGNAAGLLLTAWLLPNEINYFDSYQTVVWFAVILGLLNAILAPIINILTLPLACLTFGLIRIVTNMLVILLAAWLVPDRLLQISWLGALAAVFVTGLINAVLAATLGEGRDR